MDMIRSAIPDKMKLGAASVRDFDGLAKKARMAAFKFLSASTIIRKFLQYVFQIRRVIGSKDPINSIF